MREKEDIWFMGFTAKEIGINILSIIIGVFVSLLIIIPVGIIYAITSFSFGETPHLTKLFSDSILVVAVVFGCFLGGYFTARNSVRKSIIPIIITGLVLLILDLMLNDFNFEYTSSIEIIIFIAIVPLTIVGGYYYLRKKVAY